MKKYTGPRTKLQCAARGCDGCIVCEEPQPSKEAVATPTNSNQVSSYALALGLAQQVVEDPHIVMGGCSFNHYVGRIERALDAFAASARTEERESALKVLEETEWATTYCIGQPLRTDGERKAFQEVRERLVNDIATIRQRSSKPATSHHNSQEISCDKLTAADFECCPHCRGSFSFKSPNQRGECPWCHEPVLPNGTGGRAS